MKMGGGEGKGGNCGRSGPSRKKRIGVEIPMTMKKLLQEAALERRLVCEGAMGTQLMLAGLETGGCGELWNLTHPERVLTIQRSYVEADVDCLITNTFGASRIML